MILFTHHTGEPYGILGAQVAATFLQQKLSIPSIVVGIERNFSRERLLRFIDEYYAGKGSPTGMPASSAQRSVGASGATSRPKNRGSLLPGEMIAAFSHLCGRMDLFELARELKQEGFVTLMGGPQARQDYNGEPDTNSGARGTQWKSEPKLLNPP